MFTELLLECVQIRERISNMVISDETVNAVAKHIGPDKFSFDFEEKYYTAAKIV